VSASFATRHPSPHQTALLAGQVKTKVKSLPLVTGPKAMVLGGKIAVNVAKFLAPLPPQDAPNPAVTAVTVQPPARVVATARPAQIVRNVLIVA
jgi:hypothetical protein